MGDRFNLGGDFFKVTNENRDKGIVQLMPMVSKQMESWPGEGVGGKQEKRSLQDDMELESFYLTFC